MFFIYLFILLATGLAKVKNYTFLQEIAEDARIKVEKEQAIAELMAKETSAMAEDAQRDLGKLKLYIKN